MLVLMFTVLAGVLVVMAHSVGTMFMSMGMLVFMFMLMSRSRFMNMIMTMSVFMRMGTLHGEPPYHQIVSVHPNSIILS